MVTNGRNTRRKPRVWPVILLMAALAAVCVVALRWGLSDVVGQDRYEEPPAVEETEASTPEESVEPDMSVGTEPEEPAMEVPAEPETPTEPETPEEPAEDDGLWNLRLVNRWSPLPENYEIDLVEVPGGELVDARIYDALMELLNAAAEEELGPIVVAGYRTQEKQQSLYDEKIQSYLDQGYSQEEAVAEAEQWVAQPGTSEHQLGLAVDINGAVYAIYPWLQEHSWEYGFIFRYPADKQALTGVANEEWHYRYVGKEAAQAIHDQGLCLEEYLETLQAS